MNKWIALCSFVIVLTISSNSLAAGSGTLTVTFKYKDNSGFEQPLASAYVYLHDASKKLPLEKYFVSTPYIYGPSSPSGVISAYSVPAGSYYIRITKRNPQNGNTNKLGPPDPTDYTWSQTTPITISANATTNLGIKYADSLPITVTGVIKTYSGVPLGGRYVRAQPEPCYTDGEHNNVNRCGPVKYLALQRTGADGRFTIKLRDPGTYYLYQTNCLRDYDSSFEYSGNPCIGEYGGTVTVSSGETKTLNIFTGF